MPAGEIVSCPCWQRLEQEFGWLEWLAGQTFTRLEGMVTYRRFDIMPATGLFVEYSGLGQYSQEHPIVKGYYDWDHDEVGFRLSPGLPWVQPEASCSQPEDEIDHDAPAGPPARSFSDDSDSKSESEGRPEGVEGLEGGWRCTYRRRDSQLEVQVGKVKWTSS